MTSRDSALRFCDAADALLADHSNDDQITGRARENAQREFARNAYPTLKLACELVRELVAEVIALRTGVGEKEGACPDISETLRYGLDILIPLRYSVPEESLPELDTWLAEIALIISDPLTASARFVEKQKHRILDAESNAHFHKRLYTELKEFIDEWKRRAKTAEAENKRLRERMPCGHPRACLVSSDDERDSTVSCAWCTDRARLQEVDAANRQLAVTGMRLASGLAESKHRVIELEAEAQLNAAMLAQQCDLARDAETALARERMRATVGGGSVL